MKNQILITIDSLRYDVFEKSNAKFLKSFPNAKAYTHGTYTLPAHMSFFTGKLPCNYNGKLFDNLAWFGRKLNHRQQWRLANPEADQPCTFRLLGKNIIDGFNKIGFDTIGTGAVSWFNPSKEAHLPAIKDFNHYKWFGEYDFSPEQLSFVRHHINNCNKNYFAFMNFGETHHPFICRKFNRQETRYGNPNCFNAQMRCLEYIDDLLKQFFSDIPNVECFVCGDHGDCFGEDGLYGHSFYHPKVIEVPIIKIER